MSTQDVVISEQASATLVPRIGRQSRLLLNFWCLDAPLVALSWLWIFKDSFHLAVSGSNAIALFFTVWLIYLADRFADSISLERGIPRSARQRFCLDHQQVWIALLVTVAAAAVLSVFGFLDKTVLLRGMILGALVVLYLAINCKFSRIWNSLPVKEILIGAFFAAGTVFVPAQNILLPKPAILLALALFALLCFLNCTSIAFWERELDRIQSKHSIATRCWNERLPRFSVWVLITGSIFLPILDLNAWPVAVCIATASLLLYMLDGAPITRDDRVAVADLVMLAPLLLLGLEKVR